MRLNSRRITYITLLLFFMTIGWAQKSDVIVLPLHNSSKLPVNEITSITQDEDGYMWYGTSDGLCRDDGYNIKVFRSDFNTPGFLARNKVNYIASSGTRYVWYSTDKGVYILDKSTYTNRPLTIDDFSETFYSLLVSDKDGNIWVGGSSKLYKFNPDGSLIKKIKLKAGVSCFYYDSKGNLFVAVFGDGLYCIPAGKDKLVLVKQGFIPTCMTEDVNGKGYWVCENGIKKMSYCPQQPNSKASLKAVDLPKDRKGSEVPFFTRIIQDKHSHNIWLLSYYRGIMLLNSKGQQIALPSSVDALNSYTMTYMYEDRDGNIWISGFNTGCFIVSWNNSYFRNVDMGGYNLEFVSKPTIMQLAKDNQGMFWLYQDRNGLYLYDPKAQKSSFYYNDKELEKIPLYQIQRLILSEKEKSVWVAYYGNKIVNLHHEGMNMVLDQMIDLSTYNHADVAIETIKDLNGRLWIGSSNGLFYYDKKHKTVKNTPVRYGEVSCLVADPNKNGIWASVRNNGIVHIENNGKSTSFITSTDVSSFDVDKHNKVWLSTGEGSVYCYSIEDDELIDYTSDCGMTGNIVNDIILDKNQHVWIFANQSIREFNPKNKSLHITSTSNENMSLKRILPHSVFYDKKSDNIYIGGIPGIIYTSLSKESQISETSSKVKISNITVGNYSVWFDSLARDEEDYIELKPNEQNIDISFSSLNILQASNIRYAYRLVGLSDDWIYLPAGKNDAVFSNLSKGTYHFQVKAIDDNGLWSDEYTELTIYRQPAWYETFLAYLIYFLIVVGIILYIAYQYKQRVKQQNEKMLAEQLVQTKLRYFTNISHELLTPLAVISSINDSFDPVDDSQENKVQLIKSNISRLKHLLQQILDFRKVETQNIKLYVEEGNLSQFIEQQCKESFIPLAQNKNIRINIDKPFEDIIGYFDTDKIEKIMFNLVSNAIKYTNEQKKVTIKLDIDSDNQAIISVEDEGVGIDQRELNRIFKRFYTTKTNNASESNGIGLSLTKDLIELHHGSINVTSQRNKGSVFTIHFPLNRNAYTALEIKDKKQEEQIGLLRKEISMMQVEQHPATDLSVLVVEDNLDMLTALQELLSKQYYTYTATNGEDALDVITEHPDIQFVVSDISMPRMDGLELCKNIKTNINTSHMIVVMLTAMISSEKQVDSYNAGADSYLAKPFESKVLLALLNNLWSQREKRQQQFRTSPTEQSKDLELSEIDQQFLDKAITIVNQNISSAKLDVEFLASELCMSRSTFTRKIRAVTGETPLEFIKSVKLKYAYRLLKTHNTSVLEAIEAIGYNDRKTFTQSFKDMFGELPSKI